METLTQETAPNGRHAAPRSLAAKLARMMGEAGNINKRGWNPHHKYNYVLSTDVYEATRELMARHGVILVQRPVVEAVERQEKSTRNGTTVHTRMSWEFTWMDGETGESIVVPWLSEAEDPQDKGLNKAATAARKYFLVTQLQLPVDQEDADAGPAPQQNGNGRQAAPPPSNGNGNGNPNAQPYHILAQMAQRFHDDPAPLAHVINTLSREGIITEELGKVNRLTELPLEVVSKGIAVYQRLLEGTRQ